MSQGYKYKVAEPNLSSKSIIRTSSNEWDINFFGFKEDKCFTTLFPGVEKIIWNRANSQALQSTTTNISSSQTRNDKSFGCLLMEFDKTTNQQLSVVKTELAFKSINKGFVLWTGFVDKDTGDHRNENKYAVHCLIYLEKNEDTWNIKHGYSVLVNSADNFSIKIPTSNKKWPSTLDKTINYAGFWKSTSWSGKEILSDIYENLNGKFTNTGVVSDVYDVSNKKWVIADNSSGSDFSFSKTLNPIINISKNKKGYWIDMDSYCWGFSYSDLHLKDICYEQPSN